MSHGPHRVDLVQYAILKELAKGDRKSSDIVQALEAARIAGRTATLDYLNRLTDSDRILKTVHQDRTVTYSLVEEPTHEPQKTDSPTSLSILFGTPNYTTPMERQMHRLFQFAFALGTAFLTFMTFL